jgi:integrative and conjugative element protein (TIGR02256 family)
LTARAELHADDQPLEPFLLHSEGTLVLSSSVFLNTFSSDQAGLWIFKAHDGDDCAVFVGRSPVKAAHSPAPPFIAAVVDLPPREHGVIRRAPSTLADLHELLTENGDDLTGVLREQFGHWESNSELHEKKFVLLLRIPKSRAPSGGVEQVETWAFLTPATLQEVGVAIDRWEEREGSIGLVLKPDHAKRGQSIDLLPLRVISELSRPTALMLNGIDQESGVEVTAIGVGSLGSQVCMTLARAGWGKWAFVDEDNLLPHNLTRHALTARALGKPKAIALAEEIGGIFPEEPPPTAIVANAIRPGVKEEIFRDTLAKSDLILDMSASVPVGRELALNSHADARRVSIFLNPSGSDLVMLAEDRERLKRLDALELQYYRALLQIDALSGHLDRPGDPIRYSRSRRDVSSILPEDVISLHSSIGARVVRQTWHAQNAQISIFHSDLHDLTVSRIDVTPSTVIRKRIGGWELVTDRLLLEQVAAYRQESLPIETAGVLVGNVDTDRQIVYVALALPSPPDSIERRASYERGSEGLSRQLENIQRVTQGQLDYVGEWHSHPDGSDTSLSTDDDRGLEFFPELLAEDLLPAVSLIVGEEGEAWHIQSA